MFEYSPRRGTRAYAMEGAVDSEAMAARLQAVITLQRRITDEISRSRVGQEEEVLVEGMNSKAPEEVLGKTRTFKSAVFPGHESWIGSLRRVRIERAHGITLHGEAIPELAVR
jgi:tRNA-2-methylthio-N6-dimethylallyladenosine synthase